MKKLGFIGTGLMGSRMAANLLKEGYALYVYNRTKDKAKDLIEKGAIWVNSPKELAAEADIVISMLSSPEAVKAVALGENAFLDGMSKGSIWMNCSTVNPSFAREMDCMSQKHGIQYIDAPVAGTTGPAEKGDLVFLLGGEAAAIEQCEDLFEIMGKKTLHLGEAGMGSAMKMLINQLLAQSVAAFAESLLMGEAMGLDKNTLFDVLLNTPVVAPVIAAIRTRLENGDYEANFPLKLMQKDLHLSSVSAYEKGLATPALNATKEIFAQAKQAGFGEQDFTAVYQFMQLGK